MIKEDRGSLDLTLIIEKLEKENYQLKKNMSIKIEEVQSLNLENKHLKQQIKQLEEEQEDLLNYPWLYLDTQYIENGIEL